MQMEDNVLTIPDGASFVVSGRVVKQMMAIINALKSGNRDRIINSRFAATDELYEEIKAAKELPMEQARFIAKKLKEDKNFVEKAKNLNPEMFNEEMKKEEIKT